MKERYLSLTTTADTREAAERIAGALLEPHLAACVQIDGPFESRYWWQGRLEVQNEWRCTVKLRADRFPAAEAAIRAVHPYAVPQLVATPIVAGGADYLAWIDEVTASSDSNLA